MTEIMSISDSLGSSHMTAPVCGISDHSDLASELRARFREIDNEGTEVLQRYEGDKAVSREIFQMLFNTLDGAVNRDAPPFEKLHWLPLSSIHHQLEASAQHTMDYIDRATATASTTNRNLIIQDVRRIYVTELSNLATRWMPEDSTFELRDHQRTHQRRCLLSSYDLRPSGMNLQSSESKTDESSVPTTIRNNTDAVTPSQYSSRGDRSATNTCSPPSPLDNHRGASRNSVARFTISDDKLATINAIVSSFVAEQSKKSQIATPDYRTGSTTSRAGANTTSVYSAESLAPYVPQSQALAT